MQPNGYGIAASIMGSRPCPRLCRSSCALDELSKGKPLGYTYFALFCATWDNGLVRLGRSTDLPYASGFTGPRGVRGWQERAKLLESFGFVEIRPSGGQKFGLAFLPNPNIVLLDSSGRRSRRSETDLMIHPVSAGCRTRP